MAGRAWEMVGSFGVDDGELKGIRPEEVFVLGYELALVHVALEEVDGFERPVHVANKDRIQRSVEERGRECRWEWLHDDKSEGWVQLIVPADED